MSGFFSIMILSFIHVGVGSSSYFLLPSNSPLNGGITLCLSIHGCFQLHSSFYYHLTVLSTSVQTQPLYISSIWKNQGVLICEKYKLPHLAHSLI